MPSSQLATAQITVIVVESEQPAVGSPSETLAVMVTTPSVMHESRGFCAFASLSVPAEAVHL